MAFRWTAITGLRFDKRLVRYDWLEDRDFGALVLNRAGRRVKIAKAYDFHLGIKGGGRVSCRKISYSQVMNPVYPHRTHTVATSPAIDQAA